MENDEQLLKYDENIGLYDHINPILNLKDLSRKQVKELAKEIANNESQTHSWREVANDAVVYDSKNDRQEKRFKRIFNKQLNENLAPILEKQHKQELIDRMKSGDASAMSQWTTEGIDKFGHQFMPVMLTAATLPFGVGAFGQAANTIGLLPALGAEASSLGLGYGGYKLGSKLDDDFGTNWIAPALSAASGIGGYGAGYKGMVKLGSKGWLPKGGSTMYGKQFITDVASDALNNNVSRTTPAIHYGTVKYYGPTMGKTTAAKTNQNLVDFDDYVRGDLETLASQSGMTRQQLMMSQDPTVRESVRQLMLKSIKEWRQKPSSYGKTMVISKSDVLQDPIFDNQPLVLQRPEFLKRNAARGETDLQNSMDWYASTRRKGGNKLMEWPDSKGVYISELEPFTPDPHKITFTPSSKESYGGYTDMTTLSFNRMASGKPVFGMSNSRINPDFNDAIAIRDFAKQHGYKIPKGIERYSGEMLDNYYKKILKQHNTFGRGVTPTETVNAETQLVYPYSQSMYHGETMPVAQNGVYTLASTSPYGSVSGVIQRHLDFTGPRSTWIQKNVVQPRYYDDVSNAINRRLISDTIYKDFLLKGNYDEMWKYIEKQYPKLFDSRGRIFTQTLMPNKGTFILGGIDNNSVGTVRNMFAPYSSDPKLSTRGFSKMKAEPYDILDDDLRMLDDGNIIGFKSQKLINR